MKRVILCLSSLIIVLIVSACAFFTNRNVIFDNLKFNLSNENISRHGYAAVLYEDRIYYVSNELGDQGIYSMKPDGSDIRTEINNPSITSFEICNGTIYFNGLKMIQKEKVLNTGEDTKNDYMLYCCPIGENKASYAFKINGEFNITGFYISEGGYTTITNGSLHELMFLYDSKFNKISLYGQTVQKEVTSFSYNGNEVLIDIYKFGDLLILSKHYNDYDYFIVSSNPTVIDVNTGELVLKYSGFRYLKDTLKAFHMNDEYIYCSYNETIVILDRKTYEVKNTFVPSELSDDFNIEYITGFENNIYIIADRWSNTKDMTRPLLEEKLYVMNPDTFECSEILGMREKQQIIGLDSNFIVLLDNGVIYKAELSNGTIGEKIKITDAPLDIYTTNYTIDCAGDWMFIYKVYPEKGSVVAGQDLPGQQLLYKIKLESGEVIKNEVKLDFSALDSYKEK